jgi:hypothetical protein
MLVMRKMTALVVIASSLRIKPRLVHAVASPLRIEPMLAHVVVAV